MSKDYKIISPQKGFKDAAKIEIDSYQPVKIWLLWSMHTDFKVTLRGIYFSEEAADDRREYIMETEFPEVNPIIEPTIGNHLYSEGFGPAMATRIGSKGGAVSIVTHFHNLGKGS